MVKYTCPTCLKEFNKKDSYIKHTEKKKIPCQPNVHILEIVSAQNRTNSAQNHIKPAQNHKNFANDAEEYNIDLSDEKNEKNNNNIQNKSCLYCGLVFTRKDTLKRHMDKFCKVKKLQHEEKETILELLIEKDKKLEEKDKKLEEKDKQISELSKKIDDLSKKIDKELGKARTNNINKGVINNFNIPQNKLVNFGSEDVSKIPKECLNEVLKLTGYPALVECLKTIHNNNKYPQGMNTFISDKSRGKGMIWQDGDWKQATIKKIFASVMNKIDSYINHCEICIENGDYNTKKDPKGAEILETLEHRLKKYYNRYMGDDTTVSKKICKDFEKMTKDNIINELCNIKTSVMNNYNKILEDLDKNDKILDKEETKKSITNDRDLMLNKIEDIKEHSLKTSKYLENKNNINTNTNSDSESDQDSDSDSDSDLESDNNGVLEDDEYIYKEVTLASGLVVKKWLRKDEEYWKS